MNSIWDKCATHTNGTLVLTIQCVPVLINTMIWAGLMLAGTVSLLFIIRAGYQYIMSNGDPKLAAAARQTLTYAIIGLVVIFLAFFVLNIVSALTGTTCIKSIGLEACNN